MVALKVAHKTAKAGKQVVHTAKNTVNNLEAEADGNSDARLGLNKVGHEEQINKSMRKTGELAVKATVFAVKVAIKSLQAIVTLLRVCATILLSVNITSLLISVVVLMLCIALIGASISAGAGDYKGTTTTASSKDSKLDSTQISGDASTWVGACKLTWDAGQAYAKKHNGGYQDLWGKTLTINGKKYRWSVNDCSGTVSLALNVFGVKFSGNTSTYALAKSMKGFKKLIVGKDITSMDLQPGDILVARGDAVIDGQAMGGSGDHHVQVVTESLSKKGKSKTYNWGSSKCATRKQPYDETYWYEDSVGGCIRDGGHHYKIIWRYVGE